MFDSKLFYYCVSESVCKTVLSTIAHFIANLFGVISIMFNASTEMYKIMGIHMDEIGMSWIIDNEK